MRRLRVLLDANVIVDAQVRDLFCRLGEAELIELRWSAQILREVRGALVERLALDPAKVDRLLAALDHAFPDTNVSGFEDHVKTLALPDANDRHVLAAAIQAECDMLVTYNDADFPEEAVGSHDVLIVSVDDALVWLAGVFQAQLPAVVDRQIAALRRPALSREAFLERLAACTDGRGRNRHVSRHRELFADLSGRS